MIPVLISIALYLVATGLLGAVQSGAWQGPSAEQYVAARREARGRLALRAELARQELDGFIVPRADEHQSEYVAGYADRLFWLTGFSGSAGECGLASPERDESSSGTPAFFPEAPLSARDAASDPAEDAGTVGAAGDVEVAGTSPSLKSRLASVRFGSRLSPLRVRPSS